jgi:hypothetical protein
MSLPWVIIQVVVLTGVLGRAPLPRPILKSFFSLLLFSKSLSLTILWDIVL